MTFFKDILAAFLFLTRFPLSASGAIRMRPITSCYWAFPLVGAVLGVLMAGLYYLALWAGFSPLISTILTLIGSALMTGCFHEDGLADMADSFGGWGSDKKLAIMKDSRIGTYGTVALILIFALKIAALSEISNRFLPSDLIQIGAKLGEVFKNISNTALPKEQSLFSLEYDFTPPPMLVFFTVISCLSRSFIFIPCLFLKPLSTITNSGKTTFLKLITPLIFGIAISFLLLPITMALILNISALIMSLTITTISYQQIKGYTGDILGATQQMTETVLYLSLTLII